MPPIFRTSKATNTLNNIVGQYDFPSTY